MDGRHKEGSSSISSEDSFDPTEQIYTDEFFADEGFATQFVAQFNDSFKQEYDGKGVLKEGEQPEEGRKRQVAYLKEGLPRQHDIDNKPGNVCKLETRDGIQVGICDVQGMRNDQQDATAWDVLPPDYGSAPPGVQDEVIKQTFVQMQGRENVCELGTMGATACVCNTWTKPREEGGFTLHTQTAYVGDTSAFVIIRRKTGEVECHKLNQHSHHPNPKEGWTGPYKFSEEKKRYELPDYNPLTRAIGDVDSEQHGLTHDPQIDRATFHLNEGDEVVVAVLCDGVTEDIVSDLSSGHVNRKKEEDAIKAVVEKHGDKPLHKIGLELVRRSAANGSKDNMSALLLKPGASGAIFDGHGGQTIARELGQNFYPAFQRNYEYTSKLNLEYTSKLNLVLDLITKLDAEYQSLGRSGHNKDIRKLLLEIEGVKNNPELGAKDKFEKIVHAMEVAFKHEQENFCKPFTIFGKSKDPQFFIERINSKQSEYHYPRLLGIALQAAYKNDPNYQKLNGTMDLVGQIKLASGNVYDEKVPKLIDKAKAQEFEGFAKGLREQGGLSDSQIYRFYTGQDVLDADLATKIWPELNHYGLDSNALFNFVNGSKQSVIFPTEGTLSKISEGEKMRVRMYESLGEISSKESESRMRKIDNFYKVDNVKERLTNIKETIEAIRNVRPQIQARHGMKI